MSMSAHLLYFNGIFQCSFKLANSQNIGRKIDEDIKTDFAFFMGPNI